MSGQNFNDRGSLQTSVDLDTVLDDLRLKLKRQSAGSLQGIQNADIALEDRRSGSSQVGCHDMQWLRSIRNPSLGQINPLLLKGSTQDYLKGIHRLQALGLRNVPELGQPYGRCNIVQIDLLKELLNVVGMNSIRQSSRQNGPNADPLDSLGKLQFLNLSQSLQGSDQKEPANATTPECNCRKHFYRMGSRDVVGS